jgi:hypothetical protein
VDGRITTVANLVFRVFKVFRIFRGVGVYVPSKRKGDLLEDDITSLPCNHGVLVLGNFNARIGYLANEEIDRDMSDRQETRNFQDGMQWKSKDKMVNTRGRKMVVMRQNTNLMILNGTIIGGKQGKWTNVPQPHGQKCNWLYTWG